MTDIGPFERMLAQDQAQYERAIANQLSFEDAFSQVPVHPSDIATKNMVLGDYQKQVSDIVGKYGGDYGAAAKDIARLTTKTRQSPFFQLAPYKRQLAEEERRARLQLGPNYIPLSSIQDVQLMSPETGEWASPEELTYDYANRQQLQQMIDKELGGLRTQTRETELAGVPGRPGLLQSTVYRGIKPEEYEETINLMANTLRKSRPDLPEDVINDVASNYAQQYIQGQQRQYTRDPLFSLKQLQPTSPQRYPFDSTPGFEDNRQANKMMEDSKELTSAISDLNKAKTKRKTWTGTTGMQYETGVDVETYQNKVNSLVRKFEKDSVYNNLIKQGIGKEDAARITAVDKGGESGKLSMRHFSSDPDLINEIVSNNFTRGTLEDTNIHPVYVENPTTGEIEKETKFFGKDPSIGTILANNKVNQIGLDLEKGNVIFNTLGEKGVKNYIMKLDNIENDAIKRSWTKFNNLNNIYKGNNGFGIFYTDIAGNTKKFKDTSKLSPGSYLINVDYDPDSKTIVRELGIFNGTNVIPVLVDDLAKSQVESIYDYFGLSPEYKRPKITD
jgi:hypothetical protein